MIGKGGSKTRTYAELLDALYPLAASIRVYGDKESTVFEGTVHRDNLPKFADLLAEQFLAPRFADDDFGRNRQDALDYVTKTPARQRRRGARQAGARRRSSTRATPTARPRRGRSPASTPSRSTT